MAERRKTVVTIDYRIGESGLRNPCVYLNGVKVPGLVRYEVRSDRPYPLVTIEVEASGGIATGEVAGESETVESRGLLLVAICRDRDREIAAALRERARRYGGLEALALNDAALSIERGEVGR